MRGSRRLIVIFFLLLTLSSVSVLAGLLEEEIYLTQEELEASEKYQFMGQSFYQDVLPVIMTVVVAIFMLIVLGYYFLHLRKLLFTKRIEDIKKKSIYILPDFDTLPKSKYAYVGLIADTTVKTYLNHKQLNTHTLIAGGTGCGKTVSGMVIVEELLKKDISVVIFDPVGQWTGFLRKNEDKRMLEHYKRFSIGGGKAFDAKVIEMKKSTLNLDVLHYIQKPGLTILKLDRLEPGDMDRFIERSLERIQLANLPEEKHLSTLLVLDEVHRLLPKYGGKKAYRKLEQAVREFRKWGIGILMISQVLTDFKGAIRGNIGTEIQMRTRYEGDLMRVRERNGPNISRLIPKMAIGTGMIESIGYNRGQPYFVEFRPLLHSPHKLTKKELKRHAKKTGPVLRISDEAKTPAKPAKAR